MILEIDVGNSRVKWRLVATGDNREVREAGQFLALATGETLVTELDRRFRQQAAYEVTRVRVANVRGDDVARKLADLLQDIWRVTPEFATVSAQCAGVTNAYAQVDTMGVDRWLAMLAAYERTRDTCCVLDCGSAMTFDWMDRDGRHQGGYIVPGLYVMLEGLTRKSAALAVEPQRGLPEPGTSTASAIGNGLLAMVIGFANQCHDMVGLRNEPAHWFLTGGDASLLSAHLSWPHEVAVDLVLDGLALALP